MTLAKVFVFVILLTGTAQSQSFSLGLETGPGFLEAAAVAPGSYATNLKLGLRTTVALSETISVFFAPYWAGGLALDAGLWFKLPGTLDDVPLMRAHLATGLALQDGRFGLALSAVLTYELTETLDAVLVYTHRPFITPTLSQSFDLSLGVRFRWE